MFYLISYYHNAPSVIATFQLLFPGEDCKVISSQPQTLINQLVQRLEVKNVLKENIKSHLFLILLVQHTYIFFMFKYNFQLIHSNENFQINLISLSRMHWTKQQNMLSAAQLYFLFLRGTSADIPVHNSATQISLENQCPISELSDL